MTPKLSSSKQHTSLIAQLLRGTASLGPLLQGDLKGCNQGVAVVFDRIWLFAVGQKLPSVPYRVGLSNPATKPSKPGRQEYQQDGSHSPSQLRLTSYLPSLLPHSI